MKTSTVVLALILVLGLAVLFAPFALAADPEPEPTASKLSSGFSVDSNGYLLINGGGGSGTYLSNGLLVDSSGNLLVDCASGCGSGGGGYTLQVGGSSLTAGDTVNFNNTTPATGSNGLNIQFQTSHSGGVDSVSAEIVGNGNSSTCLSGTGTYVSCSGGAATPNCTSSAFGVVTGTNIAVCENFFHAPTAFETGNYSGDAASYSLAQVSGTGSIEGFGGGTAGVPAAPSVGKYGSWSVVSDVTSGSDSVACASGGNTNETAFGNYPAPSSTAWTLQFSFALGTDTNDYHALGMLQSEASAGGVPSASREGSWCDVTDTASQGNWACHFQNYSGGFQITNLTTSVAATTSVTTLKIVATSTEIDFYFNGTKATCGNSAGTGGCTAWTSNSMPTVAAIPTWEAKNNSTTAAVTTLYGWTFSQ